MCSQDMFHYIGSGSVFIYTPLRLYSIRPPGFRSRLDFTAMVFSDNVCLLERIHVCDKNDDVLFCIYLFIYIFLTCIFPLTRAGFWLVNASWAGQGLQLGFSAGLPSRSSSPAVFIHFVASLLVPYLVLLRKRPTHKVYIRLN